MVGLLVGRESYLPCCGQYLSLIRLDLTVVYSQEYADDIVVVVRKFKIRWQAFFKDLST